MNIEDAENAWRSEPHGKIPMDLSVLVGQVRRNEASFRAIIFSRDMHEIALAGVMVLVYVLAGLCLHLPWTFYLGIPAVLWIAGYLLIDRLRHRHNKSKPGESLMECVEHSIAQIEHQRVLLRTVLWWYLLPFDIATGAFFLQMGWIMRETGWFAIGITAASLGFLWVVSYFVYRLNQDAIKTELDPRREELEELRRNLLA